MKKLLIISLLFLAGCNTLDALQNTDLENPDVNDVKAAFVQDINAAASAGLDIGTVVRDTGIVLGKPSIVGIGLILGGLSALAGGFVEKERQEKKKNKKKGK